MLNLQKLSMIIIKAQTYGNTKFVECKSAGQCYS